jgi:alpha-tubulin suppressor-like RCC1 family protein
VVSSSTEERKVLAFGLNEKGRLGFGHEESVMRPTELQHDFDGKVVATIVCGLDHTLFVTED